MTTDNRQLQMLIHLKLYGECSTKQIGEHFPEFEDRKSLSVFLGNLNREDLIVKNNPNRWALTRVGRAVVDKSGPQPSPAAEAEGSGQAELVGISEKVSAVVDWEKSIRDTSPLGRNEEFNPAPDDKITGWDMARRLQLDIPTGSSLVIEAGEIFLAWRGARFAIEQRKDLEAFKAIQEAYIGEVA